MPHPDLIAATSVIIEQKDEAETLFDERRHEPIAQIARSAPVNLDAQISWSKTQSTAFRYGGQGGQSEGARGYLVFATAQIAERGITLAKGDRVTSIAERPADLYLTDQFFAGHMTGSPRHEYWNFVDKEPSKVADE